MELVESNSIAHLDACIGGNAFADDADLFTVIIFGLGEGSAANDRCFVFQEAVHTFQILRSNHGEGVKGLVIKGNDLLPLVRIQHILHRRLYLFCQNPPFAAVAGDDLYAALVKGGCICFLLCIGCELISFDQSVVHSLKRDHAGIQACSGWNSANVSIPFEYAGIEVTAKNIGFPFFKEVLVIVSVIFLVETGVFHNDLSIVIGIFFAGEEFVILMGYDDLLDVDQCPVRVAFHKLRPTDSTQVIVHHAVVGGHPGLFHGASKNHLFVADICQPLCQKVHILQIHAVPVDQTNPGGQLRDVGTGQGAKVNILDHIHGFDRINILLIQPDRILPPFAGANLLDIELLGGDGGLMLVQHGGQSVGRIHQHTADTDQQGHGDQHDLPKNRPNRTAQ